MGEESQIRESDGKQTSHMYAKWLKKTLSATVPPLVAFVAELIFRPQMARWGLFYPAVFLAAWAGGFGSGVVATFISSAFVWWYFIPPEHSWLGKNPDNLVAAFVFVSMSIVMSALLHWLRDLADQRRMFEALIENSDDFIGIADASGKPLYLNPAGRRMVGLAADAPIAGLKIPEFYAPRSRDDAARGLATLVETGSTQGESWFRHWQTDAEIPVWANRFVIRDRRTHRRLGTGAVARDLSELKRGRDALEEANRKLEDGSRALAESQRLLQAIMDFSPNVIVVKDLTGRYLLINRQLEQVLGISAASAKGKSDEELFSPDLAQHHRATDARVIEHGTPTRYEESYERDGNRRVFMVDKFPLHADDGAIGVGAIWSDITERKQAEEALRQREADLIEAERIGHLGSWRWYAGDDTARWSEEMYRIFGLDPSQPLPKLFSANEHLFTPESIERLREAVSATLKDGRPYQMELSVTRPDGSIRYVSAHGDAIRDASGAIVGTAGTAQDITELKEAQRLRDEWTSVIAHDLRQPIGIVLMAASALPELRAGKMSDKESLFLSRIVAAGHTLARMVNDLLDLSLLEARRLELERRWCSPRDIVMETIGRLTHITSGRRVRFHDQRNAGEVFVDSMRVGQVLGNLISNAVKYGQDGTDIDVRLDQHDGEVEISVTNQGRGIDPEDMPRLFSRFMRSKQKKAAHVPGLGIGLYIAKELIEAHGGRIWAESTPGKTTTFRLTLPARAVPRQVA
jgi:PAS domain S-box-containing protein